MDSLTTALDFFVVREMLIEFEALQQERRGGKSEKKNIRNFLEYKEKNKWGKTLGSFELTIWMDNSIPFLII